MPAAPDPNPPSAAAEAARYALLRRLAPSMRHHLVVNLQPIGMIYEVMDRRLRAPTPDLGHVQDSAGKINGFARAALQSCVDVVSWLAPDAAATCTVREAVRESMGLLATSLSFRGYALRDETAELSGLVHRAGIRNLLTATLIHCTDQSPAPADLALGAMAEAGHAVVSVTVRPTQGAAGLQSEANYRKLTWADLQAMAEADGTRVSREGDRVVLRFPWLAAAA
jgi:hypothetical protein